MSDVKEKSEKKNVIMFTTNVASTVYGTGNRVLSECSNLEYQILYGKFRIVEEKTTLIDKAKILYV